MSTRVNRGFGLRMESRQRPRIGLKPRMQRYHIQVLAEQLQGWWGGHYPPTWIMMLKQMTLVLHLWQVEIRPRLQLVCILFAQHAFAEVGRKHCSLSFTNMRPEMG